MTGPAEAGSTRAFVAVALPDAARELLAAHLELCRSLAPEFRWVAPEGLHMTLHFLGGLAPDVLEAVRGNLRTVASQPFTIRLGGRGTFGRGSHVRVVWLGVEEGVAELARLAAGVMAACAAAGIPPEERAYRGHLTLGRARARDGAPLPELPEPPELDPWRAEEMLLYRSRLGRGGPTYTEIESFPFREL